MRKQITGLEEPLALIEHFSGLEILQCSLETHVHRL